MKIILRSHKVDTSMVEVYAESVKKGNLMAVVSMDHFEKSDIAQKLYEEGEIICWLGGSEGE